MPLICHRDDVNCFAVQCSIQVVVSDDALEDLDLDWVDLHPSIYWELGYDALYVMVVHRVLKPNFVDAFQVASRYQQAMAYVAMDAVIEIVVEIMAVNCYYYFDCPVPELNVMKHQ